MRIIDPGHKYEIDGYDGGGPQTVTFMKRCGQGYPGNEGSYPGTNCQELLRVLINRTEYLNAQIPCVENEAILEGLRTALLMFEIRAIKRHGVERVPPCEVCGHIACEHR